VDFVNGEKQVRGGGRERLPAEAGEAMRILGSAEGEARARLDLLLIGEPSDVAGAFEVGLADSGGSWLSAAADPRVWLRGPVPWALRRGPSCSSRSRRIANGPAQLVAGAAANG
jgi:hypothetical protein